MKNKSGEMMIEILFALSVITVVLVTLMSGVVISVRNTRFAKNTVLSNHYAQESIEIARRERDRAEDWEEFILWAPGCETIGIFERCTNLVLNPGGDNINVTTIVSWTEGGRNHESRLSTILSKWGK